MITTGVARRAVLWAVLLLAAAPAVARAQDLDLVPGMFVGTPDGPQELAIYTERTLVGRIKPPRMALDDAQMVAGDVRVLCNLPLFRLRSIWISTRRVFHDDAAERRPLRIARRRLTVTAVFAQVVDSVDPVRWRKLLEAVGASTENPAYVFVTMENDGQVRDFVVGVDLAAALAR
jgi:hypothetical protein